MEGPVHINPKTIRYMDRSSYMDRTAPHTILETIAPGRGPDRSEGMICLDVLEILNFGRMEIVDITSVFVVRQKHWILKSSACVTLKRSYMNCTNHE